MANGFGSLFIGASGLRNAQTALNTTANNMSNVDTAGYVRQQVRFADMDYNRLRLSCANVNLQQAGLGVSIGDVVHARDIFLDKVYRQENGRREFYSVRYETADYVEDLLQELDGEEFKESVKDLWSAYQMLATNPSDSVTQNLVLQKAELLVKRSQDLYTNLQSYQSNINEQIQDDIDTVNEMGERIYELNLEIQKVEAGGVETAMTLRDERDYILDKLSAYANIDVTEDAYGFVFVDLEGVRFIDEHRCYTMETLKDDGTGFVTPYWPQLSNLTDPKNPIYVDVFRMTGGFDAETSSDIGGIKSKMMVRGDGYGRAGDLATEEAYDKIEFCTLMKVEAQIDALFSSIVKEMNDLFCPNTTLDSELTLQNDTVLTADVTLTDGTVIAAGETIPAGSTIQAGSLKILDEENSPVGVDGELPPRELFVRSDCERYTEVTGDDGKTYYIYNEEDANKAGICYNIGSVHINEELEKQITLMPAYKNDGVFETVDHDLGNKISAAWENQGMHLNPYDKKPCNFENFYDRVLSELGVEGNTYKSVMETMEASVASYDNKRQMVTGVSSDEELTQMIKYQSAYNAASRFMTVISQMTELIVTGLI
ncbi:MAG: flagellar hook-associated protein FlgK [Muribaculaceae bacterium]|nr:flagellar hook-associated protein FlgK [Roseburia sp.]MCM1429874.1 flagellar hook-associated protein FlgK [Muribaculaceae bacterium]MCM1493858.1 flagellar hook-associated protein FlgK [Muribaculaceae bacterium]